ncbi:hypothetical protein QEG98_07505 [Myxococcus sp. MxC21-1]|uniref:hypothetical protein n=1 Tax=Myxococcus sp. MxC21-1 TaxID=3041439 RepID=UPI00292F0ED3|nr:hypothetical protein [Myxococcus sp. MxC21-1]WNZ63559.1 hypothetical protein QEG98_07505 [Myxococcus sp. MxC21-1]
MPPAPTVWAPSRLTRLGTGGGLTGAGGVRGAGMAASSTGTSGGTSGSWGSVAASSASGTAVAPGKDSQAASSGASL